MRVRRTILASAVLAATLLGAIIAVPVFAADAPETITGGAHATETAEPVSPLATDVVTIYNSSALKPDVAMKATAAARSAGAAVAMGRSASIGMTALRRGSTTVQAPQSGFALPMGATVLPEGLVAQTMGRDVSRELGPDTVVMGALTASLRGAEAGDTIDLTAAWGSTVRFTIGAVVDDSVVGGTELLMSPAAADRVGISRLSRVVIWGFSSRSAIDSALSANGLVSTSVRIRRSWDPVDPDGTLGMARTKQLLGEFAYRVNANGSVSQDTAWVAANLPAGRELLNSDIPIRARCHNTMKPDLQAALADVAAAGLGGTIDVYDANRAGGCYYPRFNRLTPDSSLGFLSRHSWGQAIDTNTTGSCQGCIPDFSKTAAGCTTVRIFREHGFAWGGNFLTPDGMHFEWVGEPRDQLAYPSRFCPNPVAQTSPLTVEQTQRPNLYADDGLLLDDGSD